MRAAVLVLSAIALTACATRPPAKVACLNRGDGEHFGLQAGLQKLYPDPKQHHMLVTSRTPDAGGGETLTLDVWPMSGPQEPAPPKKARIALAPCTYALVSAQRL